MKNENNIPCHYNSDLEEEALLNNSSGPKALTMIIFWAIVGACVWILLGYWFLK